MRCSKPATHHRANGFEKSSISSPTLPDEEDDAEARPVAGEV
jgi:hypothetical protein